MLYSQNIYYYNLKIIKFALPFLFFKEEDVYMYPKTGVILPYRNIDKFGYKQYYDRKQCEECPYQKQCCEKLNLERYEELYMRKLTKEQGKED